MLSVEGMRLEGDQVTSVPWDAQGEAHAALRAIVADPRYGPPALSNAQTMTNLLKDMLPDAPRESSVLVAASEAGVAVIAVLAALVVAANRSARLRLLATGVLFGFGIQTILLFAGYEFYARSPDRTGPAGAVGILGGIVLLVAALIAAASRRVPAAVTSGSVSG